MSEHAEQEPSRQEVAARLRALIESSATREEVADWAALWVRARSPCVQDERVWETLKNLTMADSITTDRPYLYDRTDFETWLSKLLS